MFALIALASLAWAASDGSIGICTRKDEFAKRQDGLDARVVKFTKASEAARKAMVAGLAAAADADIECLIRYREPRNRGSEASRSASPTRL